MPRTVSSTTVLVSFSPTLLLAVATALLFLGPELSCLHQPCKFIEPARRFGFVLPHRSQLYAEPLTEQLVPNHILNRCIVVIMFLTVFQQQIVVRIPLLLLPLDLRLLCSTDALCSWPSRGFLGSGLSNSSGSWFLSSGSGCTSGCLGTISARVCERRR